MTNDVKISYISVHVLWLLPWEGATAVAARGGAGRAASVSPGQWDHAHVRAWFWGWPLGVTGWVTGRRPNIFSRDLKNNGPLPGAFKILSSVLLKINSLPNFGAWEGTEKVGEKVEWRGWAKVTSAGSHSLQVPQGSGVQMALSPVAFQKPSPRSWLFWWWLKGFFWAQKSVNYHHFIIKSFGNNSLDCKLWRQMGSPIGIVERSFVSSKGFSKWSDFSQPLHLL